MAIPPVWDDCSPKGRWCPNPQSCQFGSEHTAPLLLVIMSPDCCRPEAQWAAEDCGWAGQLCGALMNVKLGMLQAGKNTHAQQIWSRLYTTLSCMFSCFFHPTYIHKSTRIISLFIHIHEVFIDLAFKYLCFLFIFQPPPSHYWISWGSRSSLNCLLCKCPKDEDLFSTYIIRKWLSCFFAHSSLFYFRLVNAFIPSDPALYTCSHRAPSQVWHARSLTLIIHTHIFYPQMHVPWTPRHAHFLYHMHTQHIHIQPAANYPLRLGFCTGLCCHFQLALTWQPCNKAGLPGQERDMGPRQPTDMMSGVQPRGSQVRVQLSWGRTGQDWEVWWAIEWGSGVCRF